jgi:ubiquitin-conjugating enzyme E2 W
LTTLTVKINGSLPAGISLVSADDLETWYLDIKVLDDNPLYLNQTFRLMFRFGPQYPIGWSCAALSRNNPDTC